jgi:hypothetical protein
MKTLLEFMEQNEEDSKMYKVFKFFLNTSNYDEKQIEEFTKKNKIKKEEFDEKCYNLLSKFLNSGEWNRKNRPKIDEEELMMGIEIEYEHSDNVLIAEKISLDHLSEMTDSKYYSYLILMEKLMEEKVPLEKIEKLLE